MNQQAKYTNNLLPEPIPITSHQWGVETFPLVSISCNTYNHELYIREAIEGFLMQKTTFPIEVLIHDDASTDGTAEIIREYKKKYPNLIFPVYQTENQYSKGIKISLTYQYPRSRGKYIAFCEGDDYWTDPLKLQKQVDFLNANPEYSGASHQSLMVFADENNTAPRLFREHNITDIEIDHLLDGRIFHTASLTFRSEIIKKHSLPTGVTAGDRALFFLLATFGKIHYSSEVMCCYRKHAGGMSSWVTTEMLEKDLKIVPWISKINPEFPRHQYYQFLHFVALNYPNSLSIWKVIKHSFWYGYHSFFIHPGGYSDLKKFLIHHFPLFLKKTKFLKRIRAIGEK